jgi:hypothetical protein
MVGSSPWTIEVLLDELRVLHSRVHALRRGSDALTDTHLHVALAKAELCVEALTGDLIDLAELEIN